MGLDAFCFLDCSSRSPSPSILFPAFTAWAYRIFSGQDRPGDGLSSLNPFLRRRLVRHHVGCGSVSVAVIAWCWRPCRSQDEERNLRDENHCRFRRPVGRRARPCPDPAEPGPTDTSARDRCSCWQQPDPKLEQRPGGIRRASTSTSTSTRTRAAGRNADADPEGRTGGPSGSARASFGCACADANTPAAARRPGAERHTYEPARRCDPTRPSRLRPGRGARA